MSTLKVSNFARQGYSIVFPLFLFFSAIFCMSTRTNNLLHLSILLLLLSLVRQENRQALAGVLREQWQTWTLLAAFFIYYALSNVWGHTPQHIDSPITHGVYLTGYLLLMTMLLRDGRTRRLAMLAVKTCRCSVQPTASTRAMIGPRLWVSSSITSMMTTGR